MIQDSFSLLSWCRNVTLRSFSYYPGVGTWHPIHYYYPGVECDTRSINTILVSESDTRSINTILVPERDTRSINTILVPERDTRSINTILVPERDTRSPNLILLVHHAFFYTKASSLTKRFLKV